MLLVPTSGIGSMQALQAVAITPTCQHQVMRPLDVLHQLAGGEGQLGAQRLGRCSAALLQPRPQHV